MSHAIACSFKDTHEAILEGLKFPILVIPFGAEREGLPCQVFHSEQEITRDAIDPLLRVAHPSRGRKCLHLISKYGEGNWGKWPFEPFDYIVT